MVLISHRGNLNGKNSKLENDGIFITGYDIKGKFASNNNINEIILLILTFFSV